MFSHMTRWLNPRRWPNYMVFFVTARCNADCKMCFYKNNMDSNRTKEELSVDEYEKISRGIDYINVLGISGGEPFLRKDLAEILKIFYRHCSPWVVDLPTNAYLTDQVVSQAEEVVRSCPRMTVDIQLSIDGPEDIHNEIRGLKDGYRRLRETYRQLVSVRSRYPNLRLKACLVYSRYNQDHMEELFTVLAEDFPALDRFVFSVVHGSVANPEALELDWHRYFSLCDRLRQQAVVKDIFDLHSIFTMALRFAKNDFLKEVLAKKDMYRHCRAGRDVIVVGETGKVFPCEPLWQAVGDLRQNGYDLRNVLRSAPMQDFQKDILLKKCTCHWGLPMSNAIMLSPRFYPRLCSDGCQVIVRSLKKGKAKEARRGQ